MIPKLETVTHVRRLGRRAIAEGLRTRLSSQDVEFGLRCNLEQLPAPRPASIPLTLERCDDPFGGFEAELERATGADYGRTLRRKRLHEQGVRTLHVALTSDRTPVYVQWLVTPSEKHALDECHPGYWPPLKEDEVLLEFAYTFTPFRGMGVMADGMGQLLRVGAALGAKSAFTYVRWDNIPSLRGCTKVGFDLDHVKTLSMRLGVRRSKIRASSDADLQRWQQATAPRRQS